MKLSNASKIVFIFIFSIALFLLANFFTFLNPTRASGSINSSIEISFDLSDSKNLVSKKIYLKNTSSTSTAISEYTLLLGTANPENIKVVAGSAEEDFDVKQQAGLTQIIIDLDNQVIEPDESFLITITYEDESITYEKGQRKVVSIPKFSTDDSFSIASLDITVPEDWGNINYTSIEYDSDISKGENLITFKTDFNEEQDIFLVFGDSEFYEMNLRYQISNSKDIRVVKKITVPKDTINQKVYWLAQNTAPDYSYQDNDGNFILNYILNPSEKKNLTFSFLVEVLNLTKAEKLTDFKDLDSAQEVEYTNADVFWAANDPEIVTLSQKLTKGENGNIKKAEVINDYVKKKLVYSQDEVTEEVSERRGGLGSLNNPNNVICQSYVDLFITLARSAGVPSRAVSGFGFPDTENIQELPNGVLHSWVEVWDEENGWIAFDPTWEDTSGLMFQDEIGLGHVTWATYGYSSTQPELPVGFNVLPGDNGINVDMVVSEKRASEALEMLLKEERDSKIIDSSTSFINISVKNEGNVVLQNLSSELETTSNIFSDLIISRETATEDDKFSPILVPGEEQKFQIALSDSLKNTINITAQTTYKVLFTAVYRTQEVKEELKAQVQIKGLNLTNFAIYGIAGLFFVLILFIAFLVRTLIYQKNILKEKTHNISPRI